MAAAAAPEERADLLALINRTNLQTAERLVVLEGVRPSLEPADVATLIRVAAKQHVDVAMAAADALAEVGTPEAVFGLRKVLGVRSDKAGAHATEKAARLIADLPLFQTLFADVDAGDADAQPLFWGAMATRTDEMRAIAPWVIPHVEAAAVDLDAELQAQGRTAAGLNEVQRTIRDELHRLTLIRLLGQGSDLYARALETLLQRPTWGNEFTTALPNEAVTAFADRALARQARRKDPNRAAIALRELTARTPALSSAYEEQALDALGDTDETVRAAAVAALATLPEVRMTHGGRLVEVLAGIEDSDQRRVAAAALPSEVVGASLTQLPLEVLDAWLQEHPEPEAALVAASWLDTGYDGRSEGIVELLGQLVTRANAAMADDVAAGVARGLTSWLSKAADRVDEVTAVAALPGMSALLVSRFCNEFFAEEERPRIVGFARTVLRLSGDREEGLAVLADRDCDDLPARARDRLFDYLAAPYPDDFDTAYARVGLAGKRVLLASRLRSIHSAGREIVRLERALQNATTQALEQRRRAVLRALDEAMHTGAGNTTFLAHLDAIRAAVAGTATPTVDDASPPSEAVEAWRAQAIERFPLLRLEPGLEVEISAGSSDDLVVLLRELDQRAHSRGVVPSADRQHYRSDLEAVLRAVGRGTQGTEIRDLLGARISPELRRLLAEQAPGRPSDADDFADALVGGDDREALARIEALARSYDAAVMAGITSKLDADGMEPAWQRAGLVVRHVARRESALREDVERNEETALANIGQQLVSPFRALESVFTPYFRLRRILHDAGWRQIATALGDELHRGDFDPDSFEVHGPADAETFVVRSLGIEVGGTALDRAAVEAIRPDDAGEAE